MTLFENTRLKSGKFEIYDYYPDFRKDEFITIQSVDYIKFKGRFKCWVAREEGDGKELKMELLFENYVLYLAIQFNEGRIKKEDYFEKIKEFVYEKEKVIQISDSEIFKINDKMFKKPA